MRWFNVCGFRSGFRRHWYNWMIGVRQRSFDPIIERTDRWVDLGLFENIHRSNFHWWHDFFSMAVKFSVPFMLKKRNRINVRVRISLIVLKESKGYISPLQLFQLY
jgi:hypothetical protein